MKEDGLTENDRQDGDIHRIADPVIGAGSDQKDGGINWCERPLANEGKEAITPKEKDKPCQEREQPDEPERGNQSHGLAWGLHQQPGNDTRDGSRYQGYEKKRSQNYHEDPPLKDNYDGGNACMMIATTASARSSDGRGASSADMRIPSFRRASFLCFQETRCTPCQGCFGL